MSLPFSVILEDNHLLVISKPSGLLVQGDATGDPTLADHAKAYIKEKYGKPGDVFLGVVHRIDRPVSGLVILARTSKALTRMNELFRRRRVTKTYWAVVRRKPSVPAAKLTHWLRKDGTRNVVTAYDEETPDAQRAELRYRTLGQLNGFWLLEVQPLTGRPHQIRVQLSRMGCPIRGDVKYGYPKANPGGDINLHARRLDFIHPVRKEPVICLAGFEEKSFWEQFLSLAPPDIRDKNLDYLH